MDDSFVKQLRSLGKLLGSGPYNMGHGPDDPDELDDAEPAPDDRCECGAFRTNGTKRKRPGHSAWCPWSA